MSFSFQHNKDMGLSDERGGPSRERALCLLNGPAPELKMVCAADLMADADPDYIWKFGDKPTYLQIKTATRRGKWILKRGGRDNPQYHLEIESADPGYLVDILCHLTEKAWVNQGQLLETMMPLFRAARELHFSHKGKHHD